MLLSNSKESPAFRRGESQTWEIPVGRGHSHLDDGTLGKILEGWQLAGITTSSSGLPFDIFTDLDTAHVGEIQRPDFNSTAVPLPLSSPRTQTGPNLGFFHRTQFNQPGNRTSDPGTFGQSTSEVRRADGTSGARQIQFGMKLTF